MGSFDITWEQVHREHEWGKYPAEEVIRFVARNYCKGGRRSSFKLLDAGCGAGAVTWYLAREGFDVFAFDGSETAVRKARSLLEGEGLNANLQVCDATQMPYEDEWFDGIIDSAMINANTLDNIRAILNECHRVLKVRGRVFSTGLFKVGMTGSNSGIMLEENTYKDLAEGPLAHGGTVHFFNEEQIYDLWTAAGLQQASNTS